jgi:hypothetical protein
MYIQNTDIKMFLEFGPLNLAIPAEINYFIPFNGRSFVINYKHVVSLATELLDTKLTSRSHYLFMYLFTNFDSLVI